jgi:hypothetical protein
MAYDRMMLSLGDRNLILVGVVLIKNLEKKSPKLKFEAWNL